MQFIAIYGNCRNIANRAAIPCERGCSELEIDLVTSFKWHGSHNFGGYPSV